MKELEEWIVAATYIRDTCQNLNEFDKLIEQQALRLAFMRHECHGG